MKKGVSQPLPLSPASKQSAHPRDCHHANHYFCLSIVAALSHDQSASYSGSDSEAQLSAGAKPRHLTSSIFGKIIT